MKNIRTGLHYWFATISVFSFLVGWGMLAHSLKPLQPATVNTASVLALPPIQAYDAGSGNGNGLNFSASNSRSNIGFPLLRSGGS